MIPDTKVTTSSGDKVIFTINPLDNFILTGDYYPTNTWEWLMIKNADLSDIIGVFSSSYDKSKYFGITDLGYNAWKNITIKLEDNTLTFIYGKTTVTKDVSQYLGQSWNIIVNRANTRFKNLKHKKL